MSDVELVVTTIIAIAIVALLIVYIVNVAFSRIMFDILGVDKKLAFIPWYNSYRIFKEYKGRVWKKNWGVIYIIISIMPFIFAIAAFGSFAALLSGNVPAIDTLGESTITAVVLSITGVLILYALFETIFGTIIQVVLYWPILRTRAQEVIFIVYLVFGFISLGANGQNTLSVLISLGIIASAIVFLITYFTAASSIRRELKFGKVALFPKLDYTHMSKDEIILTLKSRKRKLVSEANNVSFQQQQQTVVDKIEYI